MWSKDIENEFDQMMSVQAYHLCKHILIFLMICLFGRFSLESGAMGDWSFKLTHQTLQRRLCLL